MLGVQENPATASTVPYVENDVLTPGPNQVATITMNDHRPDSIEAMQVIRNK